MKREKRYIIEFYGLNESTGIHEWLPLSYYNDKTYSKKEALALISDLMAIDVEGTVKTPYRLIKVLMCT